MGSPQRDRLIVDVNGPWRLYTRNLPTGGQALGTVARGWEVGALVLMPTGLLVQLNDGVVKSLDQRKARVALKACHPATGSGLDEDDAPAEPLPRPRLGS